LIKFIFAVCLYELPREYRCIEIWHTFFRIETFVSIRSDLCCIFKPSYASYCDLFRRGLGIVLHSRNKYVIFLYTGILSGVHTMEHLSSPQISSWFRVTRSLVLYVCFVDRWLSFCIFFLPLCCLFFDIRILITPLVSSNSSYYIWMLVNHSQNVPTPIYDIIVFLSQSKPPHAYRSLLKTHL
jgi:hypothetical protein